MSEKKIKLRVPDEVPEGFPEFVEQGYHAAALTPGEVVEVEDRKFADWLVRELGLEDLTLPATDGYPEDFPGRRVLEGQDITFEAVKELTREELIALNGIGEVTADAIIAAVGGEK